MSALVLAAHSGHTEVATLLLEKGADPNSADAGYTACTPPCSEAISRW